MNRDNTNNYYKPQNCTGNNMNPTRIIRNGIFLLSLVRLSDIIKSLIVLSVLFIFEFVRDGYNKVKLVYSLCYSNCFVKSGE